MNVNDDAVEKKESSPSNDVTHNDVVYDVKNVHKDSQEYFLRPFVLPLPLPFPQGMAKAKLDL